MDGRCGQYAADIRTSRQRKDTVTELRESMEALLKQFQKMNGGVLPAHIIVYRDGVSDGQFDAVLSVELAAIQDALALCGVEEESKAVKIAIVICQKRHHTRFVYKHNGAYLNPCPGLCIDATGGDRSVSSATLNEFYLNSHTAIQGTARPCKYTLLYDEIGFKV